MKQKKEKIILSPELKRLIRRIQLSAIPYLLPALLTTLLQVTVFSRLSAISELVIQGRMDEFTAALPLLLLLTFAWIPADWLSARAQGAYIKHANVRLREYYLTHVFQKPVFEFHQDQVAVYLSQVTNDMNNLEQRYFLPVYRLALSFFSFLGGAWLLSSMEPFFTVIAIVIGLFIMRRAGKSGQAIQGDESERSKLLSAYTTYVREILSAFRIIRANRLEEKSRHDFHVRSSEVQEKRYVLDVKETKIFGVNQLIFTLIMGGGMILLGLNLNFSGSGEGGIGVGQMLKLLQAFPMIIQPFGMMSESLPSIASSQVLFREIDEKILRREDDHASSEYPGFDDGIRVENLDFSYPDNPIFREANVHFEKGGKYLLIGPSGGGKSTLLSLLRKYHRPQAGRILINGVDLDEIKAEEYFAHIAHVEQKVFLFSDSLRNNLTLYRDYPESKVLQAIHDAGLEPYVAGLKNGLDSLIEDNGKNLSGGEKARVAIARALIADADLILLDEAFASLDDAVARAIEQRLLALDGITLISVSHVIFPESLMQYDAIYEVKQGGLQRRS